MNDYVNSIFAKEHKEYTETFKKGIKLQEIYDKIRVEAKCSVCSVYKKHEGYSQENWKSECKEKGICKKVLDANLKIVENDLLKDSIKERYARNVYNFFSTKKPKLLRRIDEAIIEWEDAFGYDFDGLEKGLRNSLVALIEESGGKYRLL